MAHSTGTLLDTEWTIAQSGSGEIAAGNAALNDTNYPPASALDCQGLDTLEVRVLITGGTNPTMTLEALFYDENATDGSRWVRIRDASGVITTPALTNGQAVEVTRIYGWNKVFFRVTAVTNETSTTAWKILVRPGQRRRGKPSPR